MKRMMNWAAGALACVWLGFATGQFDGFGQEATNQAPRVKTNFNDDKGLSEKEVNQVLELAKMCGIEHQCQKRRAHQRTRYLFRRFAGPGARGN
jgi:hypothetical protein